MPSKWHPHVTVAAVIERDGKFLMIEEYVGERLVLNQPAGHWERGESLIEAVVRETREETAWRFHPEALVGVFRWTGGNDPITYLRFVFCGAVSDYDPELPLDVGIRRSLWMSLTQIQTERERLRGPQVLAAINDYASGMTYPLNFIREVSEPYSRSE